MNRRHATQIDVPDRGDPDRKRALNVLAQRRYRQRRREKLQALEKKVKSTNTSASVAIASPISTSLVEFDNMQNFAIPMPTWNDSFLGQGVVSTAANCTSIGGPAASPLDFDALFNMDAFSGDVSSSSSSSSSSTINTGAELQELETSQFTFSDDGLLSVPELQTITLGLRLASMLGITSLLWDPTALHTLTPTTIPTPLSTLPTNLHPTPAQATLPHHPFFDIFPWPSIRTRLCIIFSQPVHLRPPAARDPMAMVQLMYDIDDSAEGVKISGDDYTDGKNWEVGQKVFESWWWVLDRDVVENSNALRRKRGAERLRLPGLAA